MPPSLVSLSPSAGRVSCCRDAGAGDSAEAPWSALARSRGGRPACKSVEELSRRSHFQDDPRYKNPRTRRQIVDGVEQHVPDLLGGRRQAPGAHGPEQAGDVDTVRVRAAVVVRRRQGSCDLWGQECDKVKPVCIAIISLTLGSPVA